MLTAGGKVLALHNGDGRPLWSLDFGPAAGLRRLALWRVPHDVQHDIEVRLGCCWGAGACSPLQALAATPAARSSLPPRILHRRAAAARGTKPPCPASQHGCLTLPSPPCDPQVVALAASAEGVTATVINAHTGAVLQTLTAAASPPAAAGSAPDVLLLPQPVQDGTADQHAFVVAPAGTGSAAAVLPDTPAARAAFAAARPGFAFWRVDEPAGVVRGYGFTGRSMPGVARGVGWAHAREVPPGGARHALTSCKPGVRHLLCVYHRRLRSPALVPS